MIEETLFDAEEKMERAVSVAKDDLAGVRTGRATPNMFSRVAVEYYGAMTPLNQLASINVPEARMAVIKPYDTSQLRQLEKAIRDLGDKVTARRLALRAGAPLVPGTDGPVSGAEEIEAFADEHGLPIAIKASFGGGGRGMKVARGKGEDARVTIRSLRRKAMDELHRIVRDGEAGEDEVTRAEKELQGVVDRYVSQIDDLVKHKEAELLEV